VEKNRKVLLKETIKTAEQRIIKRYTVIGTPAVDRWTVTFGTAMRGLGELPPPSLPAVPNVTDHQRAVYQLHSI